MHTSPSLQTNLLIGLLIAGAWAACPLAAKAQDATTTAPPAVVTAPESANPPAIVATPAPTNLPATTAAPETTNTPVPPPATAPEMTNAPAPAAVPVITNAPVTATAPVSTNTPATTNTTPTVIPPAPVPVPALAPAAAPATTTGTPASRNAAKMNALMAQSPWTRPRPAYQPFTLGVEAGTTGAGGGAGWRFADHFGLAGGMDYFKFSLNKTYSGIPYSGNVDMQSEYAGLNLYPWRKSSFHVNLGAYFNQNQFSGSAVSDGTLNVGGGTVPAGDSVSLVYKQQPVDPYVSIGGNVYFDKARHFSLGAELGAFYLGNPRVNVSTTAPLSDVSQANLDAYQQKVENDIKKVPVWPILKLSLNYSF